MAGNPWGKFFWQDWESDPALKLCSLAAQGLWMRMLCIAATHDPIGYVAVAGIGLDETGIARLTGAPESEVRSLLGELERTGVFSRDSKQRIYSRRMIRDARKAATARKNGKKGGNPKLSKTKENPASDNPKDKGGLKPHKPEARSQSTSVVPSKEETTALFDPAKAMFDAGRALLMADGKTRDQAGSILGKWRRDHGEEAVIVALGRAKREGALNTIEFIEGCLRQRSNAAAGNDGW